MPHSFSLPFNAFLQTNPIPNAEKNFTTFLSPNELRGKLVDAVGTDYAQLILEGKRGVTTTCGSGMTAAVLWLGLKLINESTAVSLYDEVLFFLGGRFYALLIFAYSLGRVTLHARRVRSKKMRLNCLSETARKVLVSYNQGPRIHIWQPGQLQINTEVPSRDN
jgi:hypothetical protein